MVAVVAVEVVAVMAVKVGYGQSSIDSSHNVMHCESLPLMPCERSSALLGWKFQFSVPISGTPIGSGIPILFSIPKLPVGFFF
jgi:hypothetical protein